MQSDLRAALLRYVLEKQTDALVVLDREGRVVASNASARGHAIDLEGLFDGAASDARVATFLDELGVSGMSETVVACARGGVHRLVGTAVDGWRIVVVRGASEPPRVDVELRRLRAHATLGGVAANVVHALNDVLTPTLIMSSRLALELRNRRREAAMASVIHTGATLAAALTRDVLDLVRPRMPMIERVDLNDAMLEMRPLLERLLTDDVKLSLLLDESAGAAMIDRRAFEHALLNLIVNARDALPEGGRVTVASSVVEQEGRTWAVVSVADTGVGMTDAVRERAFETFFTTKGDAGGLGLGLTAVERFVHESGGSVGIDSAPGRGTTVSIRLERTPQDDVPARAPARAYADARSSTVLLATRDERVRESMRLVLEAEGYRILAAATQDAARQLASEHELLVAVIDDQFLRRDASAFLHAVRARSPAVHIVFVTDAVRRHWAATGAVTVLAKPFSGDDIVRAVRRAVDPHVG